MQAKVQTRDNVAIVGAGISGLSCARILTAAGCQVTIFDDGAGVGGRCATDRLTLDDGTSVRFDSGAQYFTVRDPSFAELVDRLREGGRVQTWQPRLWALDGAPGLRGAVSSSPVHDAVERLVATAGMASLARSLLAQLDPSRVTLHLATRITAVRREKFDWELEDADGGHHEHFGFVVLAVPAAVAAPLLAGHAPTLRARAQACRFDPCWTLAFVPRHRLELDFDAAFVSGSALSWIADNSTKPGRSSTPCWIAQASGEWTADNLDRPPQAIADDLLAAMSMLVGRPIEARAYATKLWRHAKPDPLPEPMLRDRIGIGACGDWCGGPRIEGAFVSGQALAHAILSAKTKPPLPASPSS